MYSINKYNYKIKGGCGLTIFARSKEIADSIVSIWNEDLPENHRYKPQKIHFCEKGYVDFPPYEIEQNQLNTSIELRDKRRKKYKQD